MTCQHIFKTLTDPNVFSEWLFNKSLTHTHTHTHSHTHTNGPLSSSVCAWCKKGNGICWRGHVDSLGIAGLRAHRPGRFSFGTTSMHLMNTRAVTSSNPDCPVSVGRIGDSLNVGSSWMSACQPTPEDFFSWLRAMARFSFPILNIKQFSQSESQCHVLEDYDGYRAYMCCNM